MGKRVLKFEGVKQSFTQRDLYHDVSGDIFVGDRIGLIGQNGTGKSTFLKILLNQQIPDKGLVLLETENVGYVPQVYKTDELNQSFSLLELCISVNTKINDIYFKMYKLQRQPEKLEQYLETLGEYQERGGYDILDNIHNLLNRAGFSEEDIELKEFNELSEGQKRLVYLVGILSSDPEFLVLDEPTNHVDQELKLKYIDLISQYKGAALVVSHDRELLSKACNKIWELEDGVLKKYKGNWEHYKTEHDIRLKAEIKSYKAKEKEIERQEVLLKRYQLQAKVFGADYLKAIITSTKRKIEKLEESQPAIEPTFEKPRISGDLSYDGKHSQFMLKIEGLTVKSREKELIRDFNMKVEFGEKVALLGKNGAGKSTLIKLILGNCDYAEYAGEIKLSPSAKIGYFDQQLKFRNERITLYDYIGETLGLSNNEVYGMLGKYLFDKSMKDSWIRDLSGGEKNRLHLMKLIEGNCNFLILDEPTNHLDLYSVEALEEMLLQYNGALLIISHDRYFIDKICKTSYKI